MSKLRLGDPINGTVGKPMGGRRFLVESRDAPKEWKVELHAHKPDLIEPGAHTVFWISRIVPVKKTITVRDGDYGRLPISPAMSKRYAASITALLEDKLDGDLLADLRAMGTHVDTQDSADWLSVWRLLAEPETGPLKEYVNMLSELRDARKTDPERAGAIRESVVALWGDRLRAALAKL